MAELSRITIQVAIPETGSPSVFKVLVLQRDSAGYVERSLTPSEKPLVFRALVSFMEHLLE